MDKFEKRINKIMLVLLYVWLLTNLCTLAYSCAIMKINGIVSSLVMGVVTLFVISSFYYERLNK
jgi:uncharacterized membrane protein